MIYNTDKGTNRHQRKEVNADNMASYELTEEEKQARRKYLKKYADKYRANHKEELRAYKQNWNKEHPGKQAEYSKRFYAKKVEEAKKLEAETQAI